MAAARKEILAGFKSLHRAARSIFAGDDLALTAARLRINDEYKKNKHVDDAASVAELQKFASEVENELTTSIVQAKEKQPGIYELTMNSKTARLDNVMFNEDAIISKPRNPSKRCKK